MSTIEAEQERCLEIGQIPNGFYDGVLIQNKEQSFDVIITVSAHLGVIYLFGVPKQVVFPDLAFLFKVREGCYPPLLFCLKAGCIRDDRAYQQVMLLPIWKCI